MNILAIEPYFGGSHKAFIDTLTLKSSHNWQLLTMSDENWKWRMRASAITMAKQANGLNTIGHRYDAVFLTDMINLSDFIAFTAEELYNVPKILYFHENQLTYPLYEGVSENSDLGLINITSALAAHSVWFNSAYHRDEFIDATSGYLRRMPESLSSDIKNKIRNKSQVVYPFIEKRSSKLPLKRGKLRILWAARWAHDKNPEDFFAALRLLKQNNVEFSLSVAGEYSGAIADVFDRAAIEFADDIVHWGYAAGREDYHNLLLQNDVFVSTAIHEFFGISAVEAAAAGCGCVVPNRLAYPEVFEGIEDAFYDGSVNSLAKKLQQLAQDRTQLISLAERCRQKAITYQWQERIGDVDELLSNVPKKRSFNLYV